VKPYFGLGVNSAIEDVTVLDDCLTYAASGERGGWTRALPEFSRRRAPDAKALVDISRGLDGGFLTFVLPIILDGIFHKLAPALFMPNVIQMMLNPDWSFSAVGERKRRERPVKVGIITAVLGCVWCALAAAGRALLPWLLRTLAPGAGGIV